MNIYRIFPEDQALALAERAKEMQWAQGKARTEALTGTVKKNSEVLNHVSLQAIGKRLANHRDIQLDHIVYKLHKPKYSRYQDGDRYHLHTDAPWMGETRTDLSCTLFLSKDYDGGELIVDGKAYRGKPGEAVVYECGLPHEVTPVTSGERICVVTWLQSRIRDRHKRKLVSDYRKFLAKFEDNQELFVEGGRVHSALLRMWSET